MIKKKKAIFLCRQKNAPLFREERLVIDCDFLLASSVAWILFN